MPAAPKGVLLHGVEVAVPPDWEDWTLYRFAAPEGRASALQPPLAVKPSQGAVPFRANLLIRRHKLTPPDSLALLLETSTTQLRSQNATCKVLGIGPGEYLGQVAAGQDLTFLDPSLHLQVFQRQIAVAKGAGEAVVLTVTTDRKNLDALTPGFTFTAPA